MKEGMGRKGMLRSQLRRGKYSLPQHKKLAHDQVLAPQNPSATKKTLSRGLMMGWNRVPGKIG